MDKHFATFVIYGKTAQQVQDFLDEAERSIMQMPQIAELRAEIAQKYAGTRAPDRSFNRKKIDRWPEPLQKLYSELNERIFIYGNVNNFYDDDVDYIIAHWAVIAFDGKYYQLGQRYFDELKLTYNSLIEWCTSPKPRRANDWRCCVREIPRLVFESCVYANSVTLPNTVIYGQPAPLSSQEQEKFNSQVAEAREIGRRMAKLRDTLSDMEQNDAITSENCNEILSFEDPGSDRFEQALTYYTLAKLYEGMEKRLGLYAPAAVAKALSEA